MSTHTPIIPPWTGLGVEPAQPLPIPPWPPKGTRVVVENPADPWSKAWLEKVK